MTVRNVVIAAALTALTARCVFVWWPRRGRSGDGWRE